MIANCKIMRAAVTRQYSQVIRMTQRMTSGDTPGGTGGRSDGSNKNDNQVCIILPCCACPSDQNPSTPTAYDSRKYGHCLPSNDVRPPFDPIPNVATGIFRCTLGEKLGSGADKCGTYQCAEYFSYHHMSYYDMHLILRAVRNPSSNTGRKP